MTFGRGGGGIPGRNSSGVKAKFCVGDIDSGGAENV